jgi:rhamnosyltransferase
VTTFRVIVPVRNGGNRWQEAAAVLGREAWLRDRVVVIDSESADGSDKVALENGLLLKRIPVSRFSHGGTRQDAIAEYAKDADVAVFLTQDAVAESPRSVLRLVREFRDPATVCAFGRQLPHADADARARHFTAFNYPAESYSRRWTDTAVLGVRAAFFSNSFAAYRIESLRAVGGFRCDLIAGEDTELAMRLLQAGGLLRYCAEARVRHSHNLGLREDARRNFDWGVLHRQIHTLMAQFPAIEGEGFRFVTAEIRHFARNRLWLPLLATPHRVAIKYLFYRLGRGYRQLPNALRRALSMTRGHWADERRRSAASDRTEPH